MKLMEDIRPVTYLKNRAADLLKQVNDTRRPVVITQNGVAKAVLQDPQSYERMHKAIAMIQLIAQSERSYEEGRVMDQETVFADVLDKLRKGKLTGVSQETI